MYKARFLIVSNRKELSIKYKKMIENLCQEVIVTKDLSVALETIQKKEIEFIIISDTIREKLSDFISKIRILTYNSRPIIIAVSKSNDLQDKLNTLDSGADDFIGEEISKIEFQTRIKAHLRRYIESSTNHLTNIFDKKITTKTLKKSLEYHDCAYILVKIKSLNNYKRIHGDIASEKVLQTLGAIINSMMSNEDFAGHLNDDEAIIITNSYKAEKICAFLAFAFDNILSKFYPNDEFENNFAIMSDDNKIENKDYLMRLYISSTEKQINQENYQSIINTLNELLKSCEKSSKSTYVIDRYRLQGDTNKKENKVMILEFDDSLSCLLKNICELNNIEVFLANNIQDFEKKYSIIKPNLVILDWGNSKTSTCLDIAKKISKDDIKLIFSSSYLNKKEILKSGADLYLPKPYDIEDMLQWIKRFLNI